MRAAWITLGFVACFTPPELDLVDSVPLVPAGSCAPERVEWVSCVLDGDTFDIDACGDAERFRMLGIDAPEVAHPDSEAECFSAEATQELARLINNNRVLLTFDQDCFGVFGRTLAYVWVQSDGSEPPETGPNDQSILLNEHLLEEGFARLFDEDFGTPLRLEDQLAAAQARAQSRGLGLWSACEGTL